MDVKEIENYTRKFEPAPDVPDCSSLCVRDVETTDGVRFMISEWAPTADELAALNRGETIKLWISGSAHPVVTLTVGAIG